MSDDSLDALFKIQKMVSALGGIDRNHYRLNTDVKENDIEHSFSVALLAWYVIDQNNLKLDVAKCLQFALIHDSPELYAGDVNTFATDEERAQKSVDEKLAIKKLQDEFATFPALVSRIEEYEAQSSDESVFVWTIDKMQAIILGDLDSWRPHRELAISYEQFSAKYLELLEKASPYSREIFQTLVRYCQTTYYDRPDNPSK